MSFEAPPLLVCIKIQHYPWKGLIKHCNQEPIMYIEGREYPALNIPHTKSLH